MTLEVKNDTAAVAKQETQSPEGAERTKSRKVYVPLVDIFEGGDQLTLVADLPGVDEQGIEVQIEKNLLTIRGQISAEVPAGYQLSYQEYGIGDYERSFTIPNEIDRNAIHASIKDGVLRLVLPKVHQAAARKVPVVAG